MTPHITAEAWERRHGDGARLHSERWPVADPDLARVARVTMVVQVNGKVVDRIEVDAGDRRGRGDGVWLSRPRGSLRSSRERSRPG